MSLTAVFVVVLILVGAVTVISPLELIRTKMQSRKLSYSELRVCIRSSVAQSGPLSLWRGWGPTILRDVPFSGEMRNTLIGRHALCLRFVVTLSVVFLQLCTGLTTNW